MGEVEEKGIAYCRKYEHNNQCELTFNVRIKLPNLKELKEEIKAVRQSSDTVSSLIEHTKNKLINIIEDKSDPTESAVDNKENIIKEDIIVSLKRGNKPVKPNMVLINFIKTITDDITFQVFDQKFTVVVNAPLIRRLILPPVLFAGYTTEPQQFNAVFCDKQESLFDWYKSLDKLTWEKVGKGFHYDITQEDLNHYLKLCCTPYSEVKVRGPAVEVISECKVETISEIPACPFEKRHEYTRKKLQGREFRVVSYNTLADRYAIIEGNHSYCPPRALAIDYRKQLILKELTGYNADIICLQEVDSLHYTRYFKLKFKEMNYGSMYYRKGNRITEGLACFFNKSRFRQMESKHIVLSMEIQRHKVFSYLWDLIKRNTDFKDLFLKQSTSLQLTVLKSNKERNRFLIVANTHLFYQPEADAVRLVQINMATVYINMIRRRYMRDGGDVAVIFCGDFNSNPDRSLYSYMTNGDIDPKHEDCLKISENGKALFYHDFLFESAYGAPKYTNYTPDFKGCLDYIFFETSKLSLIQTVPLTDEEELSKHEGLPNYFFPSDHLALVVDLKFNY